MDSLKFVFSLLVMVFFGDAQELMLPSNMLILSTNVYPCSRNMACKYAVCLWEREPRITEEKCTFLDNNCMCPTGQMCALTNHMVPDANFVTFLYRCRNPAQLFRGRRN